MARCNGIFFFSVFCVFSVNRLASAISRPTSIVLENNEFKNILVAINDNVDDDPDLVQKIKDTFTKASDFLYQATNHRAIFHDVTILVPSTWTNPGTYAATTSEILNNADVILTKPPPPPPSPEKSYSASGNSSLHRSKRDAYPVADQTPFNHRQAMTKSYAGCGQQGVRVILTTDVLTDNHLVMSLGAPHKVLVHEWAHFRWGVFEEYGMSGEQQFYYSPYTGKLEGVRCTQLVPGVIRRTNPVTNRPEFCRDLDPNTGLYPEGCQFVTYPGGPRVAGVVASIMDHVSIQPMAKFCDDRNINSTRHNYAAPSRHNRLCGHRSTWDVISTTPDFANNANPPRDGLDTAPVFAVVQARTSRRLMLALDTSSSMSTDQKLTRMRQAVATYIQYGAAPSTEVGLTTFSNEPQLKRVPQALNTSHDRQAFSDDLPDTQGGATDIALALTTSAQNLLNIDSSKTNQMTASTPSMMLNPSSSPSLPAKGDGSMSATQREGGHVVVVTDGQETLGTDVRVALPLLHKAGTMVSFILLTRRPQKELEHLALKTGGRVYYQVNDHSSTMATDAFFDMMDSLGNNSSTAPIQILSQAKRILFQESMVGTVNLDEDVGKQTTFLVTYDGALPTVSVKAPSGRVYNHIYPEYSKDTRLKMVKISIPGKAEAGRWSYTITNTGAYQRVSLLVMSSPANSSLQPVRLSGLLICRTRVSPATMHIVAEATRGERPVRWLKITALINRPDGTSETVDLFDNGAGADIVEEDGVYSRFYSKLRMPGMYTVHLRAKGKTAQEHSDQDTDQSPHRDMYVERSAPAGHIFIESDPNKTHVWRGHRHVDSEAPVRIADLRVVKTCNKNRTVVLSWRASGDDTDQDTASFYEIYMAPTVRDLMRGSNQVATLTQQDVVQGSLMSPKTFGYREFCMLRIPKALPFIDRNSFVFTVVAVDEAGNKGKHSNYVTVGLGKVPDLTDHKYWNKCAFGAATTKLKAPQNQRKLIAIILGTVSGLLVLVILGTVTIYFCNQRKKDMKQCLPEYELNKNGKTRKEKLFALT